MSELMRLEAEDETVVELTERALGESRTAKASLEVRCADCGEQLGKASRTPTGVLFRSWWEVNVAPDFEIAATDRRARSRSARRRADAVLPAVAQPDAPTPHPTARHGVVALLTIPPGLPADYPDLLVRCARHGDGVLDRDQVVDQVPGRGHRKWKVPLRFPHLPYREPRAFPGSTSWS